MMELQIPEGLAVGVAYASMPANRAHVLALAIGVQNLPEGLAVSLPLYTAGASPWKVEVLDCWFGLAETQCL